MSISGARLRTAAGIFVIGQLAACDEAAQEFSAWLSDKELNAEVTSSIFHGGDGRPRFFLSLLPVDPDPHVAIAAVSTISRFFRTDGSCAGARIADPEKFESIAA
jgi:hypothetical protein